MLRVIFICAKFYKSRFFVYLGVELVTKPTVGVLETNGTGYGNGTYM